MYKAKYDDQIIVENKGDGAFSVRRNLGSLRNNGYHRQEGIWVEEKAGGFAVYQDPNTTNYPSRNFKTSILEEKLR